MPDLRKNFSNLHLDGRYDSFLIFSKGLHKTSINVVKKGESDTRRDFTQPTETLAKDDSCPKVLARNNVVNTQGRTIHSRIQWRGIL